MSANPNDLLFLFPLLPLVGAGAIGLLSLLSSRGSMAPVAWWVPSPLPCLSLAFSGPMDDLFSWFGYCTRTPGARQCGL